MIALIRLTLTLLDLVGLSDTWLAWKISDVLDYLVYKNHKGQR